MVHRPTRTVESLKVQVAAAHPAKQSRASQSGNIQEAEGGHTLYMRLTTRSYRFLAWYGGCGGFLMDCGGCGGIVVNEQRDFEARVTKENRGGQYSMRPACLGASAVRASARTGKCHRRGNWNVLVNIISQKDTKT